MATAAASNEESLRNVLQTLAGEVFNFFSLNVQVWHEKPECLPFYDCSIGRNYSLLRTDTKKAVLTFSYLFRREWERKFRSSSEKLQNAEDYESFVMSCRIPADKMDTPYYMCHFLASVAFLLELTRYCFVEGFNYSKEGERCLVKYADIAFFSKADAWDKFHAASELISVYYDRLITSFCGIFPESDILAPFLKALTDITRFDKYEKSLSGFVKYRNTGNSRYAPSVKLSAVVRFEPDAIRFGSLAIRKKLDISKGKEKVCSPKSESSSARTLPTESRGRRDDKSSDLSAALKKLTIADNGAHTEDDTSWKTENEPLIESAAAASNVLSMETNQSEHTEFDSTNSVFIMTNKYLKRHYTMKKGRKQKCKIDVKVYSPLKQRIDVVEKLDEILEGNIHENNVSSLSSETLAVGPPSWREKCDGCKLIVVNSSSEEEDDEFDSIQRSVMLHVIQEWRKYALSQIVIMKFLLKHRIWEVNPVSSSSLSNVQDPQPRRRIDVGQKREWRKKPLLRLN